MVGRFRQRGTLARRGNSAEAEKLCCGEESFSMSSSSEQRAEQEQELWRELQANVAAVAACYPSAEALREEAAEAERLAA